AVLAGGVPPGFDPNIWTHGSYPHLVNLGAQDTNPGPPVLPPSTPDPPPPTPDPPPPAPTPTDSSTPSSTSPLLLVSDTTKSSGPPTPPGELVSMTALTTQTQT